MEKPYRMDQESPAARKFAAFAGEIWATYLATHTPEEVQALTAEADRQRDLLRRMTGFRVRAVK